MHKRTHIRIARIIKKAVEKKLGARLSTKSFLYGNIKPDISYRMLKTMHCKHKCYGFLKDEINQILDFTIENHADLKGEFSRRLGVITHYISDFFCQSHNRHFEGNIRDHFFYEYRLDSCFRDELALSKSFDFDRSFEDALKNNSITAFIDGLHSEYLRNKASFHNDMVYSLKACITTAVWIISACMQGGMVSAA